MKRLFTALALGLVAAVALSQSTNRIGPVDDYSITAFPLYGAVVSPNDDADLVTPGMVRADGAGNIVVVCWGNGTTSITLAVSAGEFVPCIVRRVKSSNTTATPLHVFY